MGYLSMSLPVSLIGITEWKGPREAGRTGWQRPGPVGGEKCREESWECSKGRQPALF